MRTVPLAASIAVLCIMTSPGFAADLVAPHQKVVAAPKESKATEVVCLRWIEQTYSWYNYCDPIPYYGRQKNAWLGGL
jgi:hypothetical protein